MRIIYHLYYLQACAIFIAIMVLGERTRLIDRALSLERVVEAAHDESRSQTITPSLMIHNQTILGDITNIPKQYWSHNHPLPIGEPSHQVYCSGLNNQQIAEHADINDSTRAYCSKHFGNLKKIWRSHDCEIRSSHETHKQNGWKYTNGRHFCQSCVSVRKNLNRHHCKLESIGKKQEIKAMPTAVSIKQDVVRIANKVFSQHVKPDEAIKDLKQNADVLEDMLILAHREEASVIVNVQLNTYQINACQGVCCNEILINLKRSGNAIICRKCHNQKRSQKRAEKRRTDCFHEQVSADSKTPISALTDEQKHVRFANIRKVKKEHI